MAAVLGIVIISTAKFDPFIGMMSGLIIRALFQLSDLSGVKIQGAGILRSGNKRFSP